MKNAAFYLRSVARLTRMVPAFTFAAWLPFQTAQASGVVTNCNDANLRAVLVDGGLITFACDGTIVLTNPLVITQHVILDASGRSVSLSGNGTSRLFVVQPGVSHRMRNLALVDGLARGLDGAPGMNGADGFGGAICNSNGIVTAENCVFLRHRAQGGTGGTTVAGGSGGITGTGGGALGGAIYNWLGTVELTNCHFAFCRSDGGAGGTGSGLGGGGAAEGGVVYNAGGSVRADRCSFSSNSVVSGPSRRFGSIGGSGPAFGGAVFNTGEATFFRSRLTDNLCESEFLNSANGGAIYQNQGAMTLSGTVVENNVAQAGQGLGIGTPLGLAGGHAFGGGLHIAGGMAHLTNTTVSGNAAVGGRAPGGGAKAGSALGGGILNAGNLQALNVTLAGNRARGGDGFFGGEGSGEGGGLRNSAGGTAALIHLTVADNRAEAGASAAAIPDGSGQGGGIFNAAGLVHLQNSLLASNPSGSNAAGPLIDGGHNLSSDASCNFTAPGSLNNTDPKLGPLDDYSGSTPTMALLADSPALDTAAPASCPSTDQRGRARPFGAGCDIGAFESSAPYAVLGTITGYLLPTTNITVSSVPGAGAADFTGRYSVLGFASGPHLLTPASPECVFVPSNRVVNVGPDIIGVDFHSFRSNALTVGHVPDAAAHVVFAGESGQTYRVLISSDLSGWMPWSTNTAEASGLFEFSDPGLDLDPRRFYRVVRP